MTRSVPLMMNVPFSVISGMSPLENFLFLDVADGLRAGIRILVEMGQTNGDLELARIRHARSWHSFTSYLAAWQRIAALVAEVGVFLLNVPHLWQMTSPSGYGFVTTDAP